jgi:small-conductance mechanosensitive channel
MDPECPQMSSYWITVALFAAIVLGLAAIALAALGSRLARGVAVATLIASVGSVATSVLVAYDAAPSGNTIQPEVKAFAEQEAGRREAVGTTAGQRAALRKSHDAYWAEVRLRCWGLSSVWAVIPLLMGAAAMGLAYVRSRAD